MPSHSFILLYRSLETMPAHYRCAKLAPLNCISGDRTMESTAQNLIELSKSKERK